jgi:hypothetical protein
VRHILAAALLTAAAASGAAPAAAQTLLGRVVSEQGREPLAGAEVQLIDEAGAVHRQAVTDSAGDFRLRADAPGEYTLRAAMLGYATVEGAPLQLTLAGVLHVEVVMGAQAVVLDPVRVVAATDTRMGPLREFYDRAERGIRGGTGRIFTRLDIERGGFTEMRHLLLAYPPRTGCPMSYFIDGMPASGNELAGINPEQVEGVEIYAGPTSVPPEYARRVQCGATLVWMRRDMPGRPFSWRRTALAAGAVATSIWLASVLRGR